MTLHATPASRSAIAASDAYATETARLTELVATLSLEEKVQLLTGRDFWTTWPIEKIGLRRMLVSDGPSTSDLAERPGSYRCGSFARHAQSDGSEHVAVAR